MQQKKKIQKKSLKNNRQGIRLETHVKPAHYNITLSPDLEAHVFSGTETISLIIQKPTNTIVLHAKDLSVFDVSLVQEKNTQNGKVSYNKKLETVVCTFKQKINKGKASITLSFSGILNDSMRGFYRSRYHVDGQERILATTQFEATDARRCIPCFDEPAQKAEFSVTLIIPNDKEAISNTLPVSTKIHRQGYKAVTFAKTPVMSTYLLAFLVGDFEYLEHTTKKGVKVRIITTPGKKQQGRFALDITLRCLDFYEKYFDIPYPLNTLDMIAVPDFESGAMENWGAITYRETALLIDDEHSSISNKQRVAIVICHELAHQWFGNLVTMEWWNDLWLNEGFASYMEYVAVDALFPKWNIWSQFMLSDHNRALRLDALKSTHPIDVPVHDPNHIGEIFDAISYSKGAALIRQLAGFIGDKAFRDGLRYYLKKHSYKNTQTLHLWQAFEKTSKQKVKKFMDTWTKEPGYPLVSIDRKDEKVVLRQKRFFAHQQHQKNTKSTIWPIPVSFLSNMKKEEIFLFSKKTQEIRLPSEHFLKLNKDETGFFRVLYGGNMLETIGLQIKHGRMPENDRLGVIRDLFALADAGYISITTALSFLDNFRDEQSYIIWIEICNGLRKAYNILSNSKDKNSFKLYAQSILSKIVLDVGTSKIHGEEEVTPLLRSLVLSTAGFFGHQKTLLFAKKVFLQKQKFPIDPDIRGVIYTLIAQEGVDSNYKEIKNMYENAQVHQEKIRLLQALGQFSKTTHVQKSLQYMFSKHLRLQDRIYLFMNLTDINTSRNSTFSFMKEEWQKFKELSSARNMFGDFIKSFSGMNTKKELKTFSQFFKNKKEGIEMALNQTIERIEINIAFKEKNEKILSEWINKIKKS